jgi:hypothetical protein
MAALYTDEELRTKILALNEKIDEAYSRGRINTRMTEQEWHASIVSMERQRDMYWELYKEHTGDSSLGVNITLLPADDWIV